MKNLVMHRIVYKTARILLMPLLIYIFRFKFQKVPTKKKPCIILANHTTNWDPLLVSMSFPEHMYFVASEHIFRKGFLSKLLVIFLAPIRRIKTRTEMRTAMDVLKTIRSGCNVCMFAEGSCTWNGETCEVTSATAKLVKHSAVTLITYRLEGGYFTFPRWAKTIRRGAMRGYPVNEYSPDKLSKMTIEEIEHIIRKDLYVNAYIDNEKSPVMYRGKRLAEGLEAVLYICPRCMGISTLKSKGDTLKCNCGLSLRYTPYGYLESMTEDPAPFTTILEWDKWQSNEILKRSECYKSFRTDKPITADAGQMLYRFEAGSSTKLICTGNLRLYRNRLVLEDGTTGKSVIFHLSEITDMAIIQKILTFTVRGGHYYEIKSRQPRSALKYLMLCNILTELRIML